MPSLLSLSECGAKYALAAVEPFNPLARGACVPLPPAVGSQKIMLFARFAVTIPAGSNYGAIWFTPSLANDAYCAFYTSGAAASGTTATTYTYDGSANWLTKSKSTSSNGGWTGVNFSNCPYTAAQLTATNPDVFGRVVSMGASIQCTTPPLYVGGTLVSYSSPAHEAVSVIYGYDSLLSQSTAIEQQMDKSLHWIATAGLDDEESVYSNEASTTTTKLFPFSNGISTDIPIGYASGSGSNTILCGAPVMCFLINATPSSVAQTFNVQLIQHVEYAGKATAALQTPTHVDVVGTSQIRAALTQINEIRAQNPRANITNVFKEKLKKVMTDGLKRVAIGGLTTLATTVGGPGAGAMAAHLLRG